MKRLLDSAQELLDINVTNVGCYTDGSYTFEITEHEDDELNGEFRLSNSQFHGFVLLHKRGEKPWAKHKGAWEIVLVSKYNLVMSNLIKMGYKER